MLEDIEIGLFEDLFDPACPNQLNIKILQNTPEDNIEFWHEETSTAIQPSLIRCINYIHYDSLRNPVQELNFDKSKGVGKFLNHIIKFNLDAGNVTDLDLIEKSKVETLVAEVNVLIEKIKSFKDFRISAVLEDEIENLLSRIMVLKDDKNQGLYRAGYGVQFLILVTLSILEKLLLIKESRWDKAIFVNEQTNARETSLVLGIDEPEIHLHPYMQRALIKYLSDIIQNLNSDFQELTQKLFNIDGFNGQIVIVTHSPNILMDDYNQVIRFYQNNGIIASKSGSLISFSESIKKHLLLHLPFIKEAFFSRCVIVVEGASELGSFPLFAQKLGIFFDDYGIGVIQANGSAIPQIMSLLTAFGIPSVGIRDKDEHTTSPSQANFFQTQQIDFEEEIIELLLSSSNESILRDILCIYDSQGINRELQAKALNKRLKKYAGFTSFTDSLKLADIDFADIQKLKAYYLAWFSINKTNVLGRLIGEKLEQSNIPSIYQDVINQAVTLAQNV